MSEATSTFTIRGLKAALKYLRPRQTALIRGPHGIGKSAVAYQMAEVWGLKTVIERRISQLSEGDMIGLPDRGAVRTHNGIEHGVTKFLPTDWFLQAEFEPCLVFLDEVNRGTPEVMQACFQFIEKGEMNGRKIHPESRIIAAINYSKEYQVTPLDPAFLDRFWVADLSPDKTDWLNWARLDIEKGGGGISLGTIDFIAQCNEDHFEIKSEKLASYNQFDILPSRRSWERLDRHVNYEFEGKTLADNPTDAVFYDICRGFVGPDAARAYSKFLSEQEANVTPEDVINDFKKVKKRVKLLKPEGQVALIDKIKHYILSKNVIFTNEQGANLGEFMKCLKPEVGVTMWTAISSTNLQNAAVFHKYIAHHFIEILSETKIGKNISNK